MATPKIMVVDDEKNMRELLTDLLELEGFSAEAAADGETALEKVKKSPPDLMVLDLRLPGIQGMEVLKKVRASHPFPVVIITAHGDLDTAVEALKNGASDFILKPFDNHKLMASVRQALETRGMVSAAGLSRPELKGDAPHMVGKSPEIRDVFGLIEKVAGTEATVLIQGESGTGKELVARSIHLNSSRRDGPMMCLNCAALPETLLESELFGYERGAFTGAHGRRSGKIELAHGGTLFLDEVGDLSPSAQAKLLRVLEEKEFTPLGGTQAKKADIRVIAATNRDLESMSRSGTFREDLFYRLNVVPVYLPPLRDRSGDIPILAGHFLEKCSRRHGKEGASLSSAHVDRMLAYPWPGNIRELEHAIEKFVILGELPIPEADGSPGKKGMKGEKGGKAAGSVVMNLKEELMEAEREIIVRALREAHGNKTAAAKLLGVSYKTLFNKIGRLGITFRTDIE